MYKVELDLKLGLIQVVGGGAPVYLTRTLTLPFPAFEGLVLFAKGMDSCPKPEGLQLSEVVWDMDREVFLAETGVEEDVPVGLIAVTYQEWIDRGWTPGSCRDPYPELMTRPTTARHRQRHPAERMDFDELEEMQRAPGKDRPEWYMEEFRAVIRHLSDCGHDRTAYAMDRTRMLREYREIPSWETTPEPLEVAWNEALDTFDELSPAKLKSWERKVRRYPKLFAKAH